MPILQIPFREAVRPFTRAVRHAALRLRHRGRARYCPGCDSHVAAFLPSGTTHPRPDARCPICGGLERHRLIALFFRSHKPASLRVGRLLHFAAEPCLRDVLARAADAYVRADLDASRGDVVLDLTQIDLPDASVDSLLCSHVLEHVDDDLRAMREIRRVLRPDGWALILVPLFAEHTWEDATIVRPEDRVRHFGQHDHVRAYGPDVADRLRSQGLEVEVWDRQRMGLSHEEAAHMGVTRTRDVLFLCRPTPSGPAA
jgi:SAM-dependent methyltransferase